MKLYYQYFYLYRRQDIYKDFSMFFPLPAIEIFKGLNRIGIGIYWLFLNIAIGIKL